MIWAKHPRLVNLLCFPLIVVLSIASRPIPQLLTMSRLVHGWIVVVQPLGHEGPCFKLNTAGSRWVKSDQALIIWGLASHQEPRRTADRVSSSLWSMDSSSGSRLFARLEDPSSGRGAARSVGVHRECMECTVMDLSRTRLRVSEKSLLQEPSFGNSLLQMPWRWRHHPFASSLILPMASSISHSRSVELMASYPFDSWYSVTHACNNFDMATCLYAYTIARMIVPRESTWRGRGPLDARPRSITHNYSICIPRSIILRICNH